MWPSLWRSSSLWCTPGAAHPAVSATRRETDPVAKTRSERVFACVYGPAGRNSPALLFEPDTPCSMISALSVTCSGSASPMSRSRTSLIFLNGRCLRLPLRAKVWSSADAQPIGWGNGGRSCAGSDSCFAGSPLQVSSVARARVRSAAPPRAQHPRRGRRAVTGSSSRCSTRPAARSAHLGTRTPLLVPASFSGRTHTRRFSIRRADRTVEPRGRGALRGASSF